MRLPGRRTVGRLVKHAEFGYTGDEVRNENDVGVHWLAPRRRLSPAFKPQRFGNDAKYPQILHSVIARGRRDSFRWRSRRVFP